MERLFQDIRYGIRSLLRHPGFTLIAVLTLALGIGANTAIFSVVNAVLLRPLPYPESDKLLFVGQAYEKFGISAAGEPKYLFWREQNQSFEEMTIFTGVDFNLAGGSEPEYVDGLRASEEFFRVFRIAPAIGRGFTKEEDSPSGAPVAILSNKLWHRSFGADSEVVGRQISLNDKSYTVIGVMPPNFQFTEDVIVPLRPSLRGDVDPNQNVVGRLKAGVTREQAQAEMRLIADKYREAFPNQMQPNETVGVMPYQELFTRDVQRLLWILFGAVGFVLLIACANVANLQLTRATARHKEIAIRQALGANGWRILRQLLTESLLLAILGGMLGLLIAIWGTDLLIAAIPPNAFSRVGEINFDWHVLAFTLAATFITGLLLGLAPARQSTRIDVNTALKESSGKGLTSSRRGRLRSFLVIAEVALSLVLLTGAALLIRTFVNLRGVEPGFDPRNVLTFQLSPSGGRYDTTEKTALFFHNALERLRSLPGVESAALTTTLPLVRQLNFPFQIDNRPDSGSMAQFRMISADYFRVMKINVEQGRAFSEADRAGAEGVAVVNDAFARKYLQGTDPLYQRLIVGRGLGEASRRIVGIVGEVKQFGLDKEAPPMLYIPIEQVPDRLLLVSRRFVATKFAVRTAGEPLQLAAAIKSEIAGLDPTMPVAEIRSMEDIVAGSIAPQRFSMLLIGVFATLGLTLAAIGIYGVMSYAVAQRTNEIGIRMALGARGADVLTMVVKEGVGLALIGVAVGMAASFALTRLLQSLMFGVSVTDPLTFVAVPVILAGVALVACLVPARRAAKTDPMVALRYE